MLGFIGDVHGDTSALANTYYRAVSMEGCDAVIQVGDMGWYENIIPYFERIQFTTPIYWVDGNHEQHPLLVNLTGVTELLPNFFYCPRGTVLEIDGKKIGFLGGAASVDKELRLRHGMAWHSEEQISDEELARFDGVDKLDILVTHTPPRSVIEAKFDPNNLRFFDLPPTWVDPSSEKVEALWKRLNKPTLICGHMHRSVTFESVVILDINQLYLVP
jgi:predicted phosphodiesterase